MNFFLHFFLIIKSSVSVYFFLFCFWYTYFAQQNYNLALQDFVLKIIFTFEFNGHYRYDYVVCWYSVLVYCTYSIVWMDVMVVDLKLPIHLSKTEARIISIFLCKYFIYEWIERIYRGRLCESVRYANFLFVYD